MPSSPIASDVHSAPLRDFARVIGLAAMTAVVIASLTLAFGLPWAPFSPQFATALDRYAPVVDGAVALFAVSGADGPVGERADQTDHQTDTVSPQRWRSSHLRLLPAKRAVTTIDTGYTAFGKPLLYAVLAVTLAKGSYANPPHSPHPQ